MLKSILVPLDGSALAECALPTAIAIARRYDARLHIIMVDSVAAPFHAVNPAEIGEIWHSVLSSGPQGYLTEIERRITMIAPLRVERAIRTSHGRISDTILEHSRNAGSDLVVMTTHGYGPFKRLWFGSVADAVVRKNESPTLIVPPTPRSMASLGTGPSIDHVLVPLDGSIAAERVLEDVGAVASPGYDLTLVHVVAPIPVPIVPSESTLSMITVWEPEGLQARQADADSILDRAAVRMRAQGVSVNTCVLAEPNAAAGILEYAGNVRADLIALTTHATGGARRLVLGSVADRIVRGSRVPVLVCRPA
jgi:nucleotide-binding universal stress UspA family protein